MRNFLQLENFSRGGLHARLRWPSLSRQCLRCKYKVGIARNPSGQRQPNRTGIHLSPGSQVLRAKSQYLVYEEAFSPIGENLAQGTHLGAQENQPTAYRETGS